MMRYEMSTEYHICIENIVSDFMQFSLVSDGLATQSSCKSLIFANIICMRSKPRVGMPVSL